MRLFPCVSRAFLTGLLLGTPAFCDEATSRLITYQDADQTLFALSLKPTASAPNAVVASRIAIIVDTSATQSGSYRSDSMELARRVLESLPENAMASLIASDVESTILGVGKPNGTEIQDGLKKLSKTIPLGSTDLVAAIQTARQSLGATTDSVILYIGDGFHRCNLLEPKGFEALIDKLRETRTTINSLAIGPEADVEFLATLANHTGGVIYIHKNIENSSNQQIAATLAKNCISPVFWPTESKWSQGLVSHYPEVVPPIRTDRDSIVVGKLTNTTWAGELKVAGSWNGKQAVMSWNVKSEKSNEDLGFLPEVIEKAELNQGLLMPTPGSDALLSLGRMLMDSSEVLVKDARFALHSGDRKAAISIAKEALKRSPNSLSARNILEAAEKVEKPIKSNSAKAPIVKFISAQVGGDDPFADPPAQPPATKQQDPFGDDAPATPVVPPSTPMPAPVVPNEVNPGPSMLDSVGSGLGSASPMYDELANVGDLLAEDEALRRVSAQQLEAQVRAEISAARKAEIPGAANSDLGSTKLSLKSLLDQVRRAPELDAASRVRLERMVADAIQKAARAEALKREEIARQEAVRSSQSVTQRLLADSDRRQETIKQLVERYDSLMRQQLFSDANTEVAPAVTAIDRDSVIDIVTNRESNIAANAQLIEDVLSKRRRAFVDALYLNELATVPFVDEPPVRYPPADVWQALSRRRLERYGSIDLSGGNPAEKRIFSSLSKPVEVDLQGLGLSAVMKRWAEYPNINIPIVIDERALEEEAISLDEQITLQLGTPVSFRSALKLVLEPLNLTYVIEDEVMRITTKTNSANVTRVYPVGDLVVPNMGGMGGGGMMGGMGGGMGGMGGGMGGMGGGMGGMGGGMGGMGGGMGGMGGGMGGMGGMFDVTDSPEKTPVDPWKLVTEIASEDRDVKLAAEEKLSKWVSRKMSDAKKASKSGAASEATAHFEEIIEVISESMRQSLPAVWMYDALSTAMQANEYPAKDIRRVLLSSIDYGADEASILKVAKYLSGNGFKKEALNVLHDIEKSTPGLKDVLELALNLSVETEDQDAMRWASTAVLSQGWPDDYLPLIEKAILVAKSCYVRLAETKQAMKAYEFEQQLKTARVRDLVVRIVWTGDADIDLSVEEPAGSVCDAANQRTASGGLLLGDSSAFSKSAKDGFSETYVCSSGYAGTYRIVLKKVWGELAGGKVTVNIVTDYGTPEQKFEQKVVTLDDNAIGAFLPVQVQNGHRKEPVSEAYLAKVRSARAELGAVLAQAGVPAGGAAAGAGAGAAAAAGGNESSGFDPLAWQYFMASQFGGRGQGNRGPMFGRGAVGYAPQITVIPSGTFLQAGPAVISGDRRYVRATVSPNFSDIVAVDTFNFASGASTNTGAGGGAGGGIGGGGGVGGGAGGGFGGGGAF